MRNRIAGSYDTSVFSVSRNLRAVFHHGFTIYISTETEGEFFFLYILCSNYSLRSFRWWPLWPVYARYHLVVLFGIDLVITDVDYLSMHFYYYFTSCESNLPLQSGFLKVGPVWNFFSQWFTPGHFLRAGVIYLPSQTVIYKPSRTCDYYEPFSICFKVYILIWTS